MSAPTTRRVALHLTATLPNLPLSVRALPETAHGETVVIDIGLNALVLDVETANDLAQQLTAAVEELDRHADALSVPGETVTA